MNAFWRQVSLLTGLSALTVGPQLFLRGTNIVTHTYAMGAARLWGNTSPYLDPAGAGDWFKYSPFFALLYTPFIFLSSSCHALAWGLLNAAVFWAGISRWFLFSKRTAPALWIALILCSMELDGSLRYQQINALLVGAMLWAAADYRDGRLARSGSLLALVTNFKLLPGLVGLGLAFPLNKKYAAGGASVFFVAFLLPALIIGIANDFRWHADWFFLLRADTRHAGILDIETVLGTFGYASFGKILRGSILLVSLAWLAVARAKTSVRPRIPLGVWLSLALLCLLLVNPRTESPTFVLASPVYLFLIQNWLNKRVGSRIEISVLAICGFLITFSFNDLWPKTVWNPHVWHYTTKTLGTTLLWMVCVLDMSSAATSKTHQNPTQSTF